MNRIRICVFILPILPPLCFYFLNQMELK